MRGFLFETIKMQIFLTLSMSSINAMEIIDDMKGTVHFFFSNFKHDCMTPNAL